MRFTQRATTLSVTVQSKNLFHQGLQSELRGL